MTPIEIYDGILVKRDDLCFPSPAPPFSKCRGILKHLESLKKKGITTVGYTETSISMAGWGVAWACKELGMTAVLFDPQYKNTPEVLAYHREHWKELGATIETIPAGMAAVNFHISKKRLAEKYKNSILLPLGLPFEETIEETMIETIQTMKDIKVSSVVVCIGSGTIFAGIYRGLDRISQDITLYGVFCRKGNEQRKRQKICKKARVSDYGIFKSKIKIELIDEGWEYTNKSKVDCPFPCHPYYDLKAWEWLMKNKEKLKTPILFWNVGK